MKWLFVAVVALSAAGLLSAWFCYGETPATSWDSPKMASLQRQWESIEAELDKHPQDQEWWENVKLKEHALLKKSLTVPEMRHLAATCGAVPMGVEDLDDFHWSVIVYIAVAFMENGDREGLVTLFSRRFPESLWPEEATARRLIRFSNKAMKDPVLVLGEAYSRCKDHDVRRKLAKTVRCEFEHLPVTASSDDAQFVSNAMQWYEKNKAHLRPRDSYTPGHPYTSFQDDREEPRKR
jgi:hypothetical protein